MRLAPPLLMLALGLSTLSVGCAPEHNVDASTADATAVAVDWIPWEEPVPIGLDTPVSAEVAYGQCVEVEPEQEEL